jgi:NAD-dependent deacetylase sirtuin 4
LLLPAGDVELAPDASTSFAVADCTSCGGLLKPHVVFFGDNLPAERAARSRELAASASGLLVVGSSLATWSAFRLAQDVAKAGRPVAILNIGATRADGFAALKLDARAAEALPRALAHGGLDLPPLP